ncbi:uncharacterized protein LOC122510008 [Leptopilina heterotoma]|uniref:uncharacterized protein LOC122510008 n=1 Tax=Leptopilina heterotoma TaxID=63436 RepID=UPI001CA7E469|nr:uncharacterized protein LOC122510008 [Leptopilina heterotoma]
MNSYVELLGELGKQKGAKRIVVEYGRWVPVPHRINPNLGWDFSEELLNSTPPRKYSRMIWRQEYYWRRSTEEYLGRGFWATASFRDPVMVKREDGDLVVIVGGESNCIEEERVPLKDLLAHSPPRFGAYTLREEYFLSYIQEFVPVEGEMICFRSRWQLVRTN